MKHLLGLDHVVVLVRDLDAAADRWRRLGFTLSPRGIHSAHMGTGNYTVMLGVDYVELLGIVADTPYNARSREWLTTRQGLERAALRTNDAAAGVAELAAHSIAGVGPLDFGRPVRLPDGTSTEARFRVFQWPPDEAPAGLRIFACQHLTPEMVWIPALQAHPNTARRIRRVEVLSADPAAAARHLARLIDGIAGEAADGSWQVLSGRERGVFVFVDREGVARHHPGLALDQLPAEGGAGVTLEVADLDAAAACVGALGTRGTDTITVPPDAATGLVLEFVT
ncbi:MAG TPA: VOC family protein [Xanthobacteraceae bacterium]|nr:VOC family protein [Xanthobacteraceae bacterium]